MSSCPAVWDSANARLFPCAIPLAAAVPALTIAFLALRLLLAPCVAAWRPQWTRPFVSEEQHRHHALGASELPPPESARQSGHLWVLLLFIVSNVGAAAKLSQVVGVGRDSAAILLFASWIVAVVCIAVQQPRSCPSSLLTFFVAALVVELASVVNQGAFPKLLITTHYVTIAAAAVACLLIALMPFRSSLLPTDGISPVGKQPSSELRSPEDNLRLWQFLTVSWMAPLISTGKSRQLNEEDVWTLGFDFQHSRLHRQFRQLKGSVLVRLLQANAIDIVIISVVAIVQMLCDFSTPVLLQQLLLAMQDPLSPRRVAMTYAVLTLVLRLVIAQTQVFNLWYGRRCYERSRGELIMMVYEKALARKNIIGSETTDDKAQDVTHAPPLSDELDELDDFPPAKQRNCFCSWIPWGRKSQQPKQSKPSPNEAASMGKIFNLLRADVYEVAQRFWEIDALIDKPIGLIIVTAFVWQLFGPSCLLGVVAILVAQVLNVVLTRILTHWVRVLRTATDARLQISSQFVEAIRHLRWYGWQDHWLRQVMAARQHELHLRIVTTMWGILVRFVNAFASGLFPVIALYAYTVLAGHPLRIDLIFPALQLFTMLETRLREIPDLILVLINASVAMGRIEDFMGEPDKEKLDGAPPTAAPPQLELESCSWAWPGRTSPILTDVSLKISPGLTVVFGKVGAGKTAFLQALLGELDRLNGVAHVPNEMVGYCAQIPWLQSMSIRDNILFSAPYDEARYKQVLDACALLPDLSTFTHGDLSFVGENGIGLSGGQKARVALARAMYSMARVLYLDDPISALDHNTAESLIRKCFTGPLMRGRTVVLVTHRVALVRSLADQMIEIENGHVRVLERAAQTTLEEDDDDDDDDNSSDDSDLAQEDQADAALVDEATAVPDKFIEEEHRAEFGVKARVYWTYIRAGQYKWWIILVIVLAIYRTAAVAQSWFLKEWGEAYGPVVSLAALLDASPFSRQQQQQQQQLGSGPSWTISVFTMMDAPWTSIPNPFRQLPSPDENVRPWLWIFLAITTFQSVMLLVASLFMLVIVYCAGRTLFRQVMLHVSQASFRFFDVTPVGRLMNRLTSDISVVDGNISEQFQRLAFQLITWISAIVVIASVTPSFLLCTLLFSGAFIYVFRLFLPTSQSLRRLEMVSLSPLLSNFGELLHGLGTVRAFRAQERFQDRVIAVVDRFQGMDHFYWSLQSWLSYRSETLSALSIFCLTVLALYTDLSPGLVAFVLIAGNNFVTATHSICKQYGQLQMDFVSVERVDELLHIDQEPSGTIDPPAAWPRFGSDIVFEDVTMRYAPHLDPSLRNVSLRIPGGSTTAVMGRTGSGKSTLAVSLLSVLRPSGGRILIDGLDISEVRTQVLRTRVTFVAQEPVLFPGSIRHNLDPTAEYSDEECQAVLHRVCHRHGWTLDTPVEAGGRNLSQGQRQLIGLTRAVLRRSAIVILDEATASIDHETSLEIQQIVREELQQSTVITIAHRLEAVKDATYYVVLDKGQVSEHGPATSTADQ
ncbi:hypothetical protein ASPZODRAFT_2034815 [Penicilliopsis zonata CBS 506.65]|uniref:ABC transporter n=1 Tax=Penicilliopsis zonata CBS 506.65 TaxID=1073090 RepID=A0A1L9SFP4_9EURO|nr:hypothetical protein ASPZODRAFT_2034815 [Penicilliopsis zonata CBS 506.65]OJJ46009.1 hypothetical protein ASPZODRAFT_2034815 [Penicilliopsis zonata CBS 506.65]